VLALRGRHVKLAAESGAIEKLMITVLAGVLEGTRRGTHSSTTGRLLWQDTMFRNRDLAMRAAYVALVETVKASRGEVRAQRP
jgi:stalled ribosome rescue protein Dom34